MKQKHVKAAFVIIGDEILSGRTQDANLNFLAKNLTEMGINLHHVRVIPDIESEIVDAINELRQKYDYVFTSGGVGPTHDDITSAAIAKAFGDQVVKNEAAAALLTNFYGEGNVNEARMKMAMIPSRAKLLSNPVSSAPGFRIENVFVMAGIPKIFQAMFIEAKKELIGGEKTRAQELKVTLTESVLAKAFSDLQQKYPQVVMGSYPSDDGTSLVFRSTDYAALDHAVMEMSGLLQKIKSDCVIAILKSE